MLRSMFRTATAILAALVLALPPNVHAGTPLICFPYEIGKAQSLPGDARGPHGTSTKYDRRHLVADTLGLLTPEMPIIVRMETIRRAVVYATQGELFAKAYSTDDKKLIAGLLAELQKRADAADKASRSLATFDLGFYSETLRQAGVDSSLNGYLLLTQALALRGADAEMEFALALASSWPKDAKFTEHLTKARAGAAKSVLLKENLASHLAGL